MIDIATWAESRYGFFVDRHYDIASERWILQKAPIKLSDYHKRILRHCFTVDADGKMPYQTVAICEPAKSGKSALAALVHGYFALHVESPSEQFVISNKRDQAASKVYKSLCESFEWNPHLLIQPNRYELTTRSGTIVRAIPSNPRTESGARFTLASFDEPWAIVYTDNERLVSEFKHDPTRNVSIQLFTGYAGYMESELWHNLLLEGLSGEPVSGLDDIGDGRGGPMCWRNGRLFVAWNHECKQPWQTDAWLASQRASLRPAEYSRIIECDFVEGTGNFCDPADWQALIDPALEPLRPGDKTKPVYIGLDLALSAQGDDCALVGVYPDESGRVAVGFHRLWKGEQRRERLKLGETVKPFLLWARDNYRIASVNFDPWQAQHLMDELRREGLHCVEIPQTRSSRGPRDTRLWELVANRQLRLYNDDDLRSATAGANAQELGDGRVFLKKATGRARIDLLVALSNCASEIYERPVVEVVNAARAIAEFLERRNLERAQPAAGEGIVTLSYSGDRTLLKRVLGQRVGIKKGFSCRLPESEARELSSFFLPGEYEVIR